MRDLLIAGLALVAMGDGAAQEPEDAALSGLAGEWVADCDAFAEGATCWLEWSEGLHADLMRVRYEVSVDGGRRLFAGEGVYRATNDGFEGFWSDTEGSLHPLDATIADGVLTTLWGRPGTEQGRTRYALDGAGGLSVTDWVKVDGAWRQFMQADYERMDAAPE